MPRDVLNHAAVAMGGKIYVTGGDDQMSTDDLARSVYVYDPQVDVWTHLASMNTARRLHASAAIGGKLYVFGGFSDQREDLGTAEVYDPATDCWAQASSLTSVRKGLVAVAL